MANFVTDPDYYWNRKPPSRPTAPAAQAENTELPNFSMTADEHHYATGGRSNLGRGLRKAFCHLLLQNGD